MNLDQRPDLADYAAELAYLDLPELLTEHADQTAEANQAERLFDGTDNTRRRYGWLFNYHDQRRQLAAAELDRRHQTT